MLSSSSGLLRVLKRDLAIGAATALLWLLDGALRGGGWGAEMLGVLAGVATAACGYLAHEWGHLGGALLARSAVALPENAATLFLFRFDSVRNSRGQLLCMSFGGFAASAVVVALVLTGAPLDATSGRVAAALTLLGVLATAVLEFPVAWQVARGGPLPRGAAFTGDDPLPDR